MGQYLNKFRGTIGKRQAQQVLNLISKQRDQGKIRSVKEFSQKLETLMRELTSTTLQPSLSIWAGEKGEDINSESYNFMLERLEDDLVAGFEEANKIEEIQESHEALIRDLILKSLKNGLAELESKIDLYEFISKDIRSFDNALFSTFRESKEGRLKHQGSQSKVLFIDPRKNNEVIDTDEDAEIELVGERLVLANQNTQSYPISSIRQIFDSEALRGEIVTDDPLTPLSNIIDNQKGTYWIQSIHFSEYKESIKTKIELTLASKKEINYIEIDPITKFGMTLEQVYFVDSNNVVTSLEIDEQLVTDDFGIKIKKITTDRIILVFRTNNPFQTQFQYKIGKDSLLEQASTRKRTDEVKLSFIQDELNEAIDSLKIKSLLGISNTATTNFSGYDFTVGVDNVRFGYTEYEERSIYVSTPMTLTDVTQLGLKTVEKRPYMEKSSEQIKHTDTTYDIDQDSSLTDDSTLGSGTKSNTWFQGSIEYWVARQDYSAEDILLSTSYFPILPLDVDRVYHERLVLSEKSSTTSTYNDISMSMFFSTRTDGNIKVFRNGVLLEDITDNALAADGWKDITTVDEYTPNSGEPMRMRIQILGSLPGDIITLSYTPLVSSTNSIPSSLSAITQTGGIQVVDLQGDLSTRSFVGQAVFLNKKIENLSSYSKLFLLIILRRNSADLSLTPAVEEYRLMASSQDSGKFEVF